MKLSGKVRSRFIENSPQLIRRHWFQLVTGSSPINPFVLDRHTQHVGRRSEDQDASVRVLNLLELNSELKSPCQSRNGVAGFRERLRSDNPAGAFVSDPKNDSAATGVCKGRTVFRQFV